MVHFDEAGIPQVIPSYPQIKLWQSSADLLNISTQGLRRIRQQDEKFALPISDKFFLKPLPIEHVIEINPEGSEDEALLGAAKLNVLTSHSYRYHFLKRMGLTWRYTKDLIALADKIAVSKRKRIAL